MAAYHSFHHPSEKAYETVEEWERTGESKLLQQSKNM